MPADHHPGVMWDDDQPVPRLDELNAVTQSGRRRKIRSGKWSLLADITGDFWLFDLSEDPFELNDLWNDPGLTEVRTARLEMLVIWQMRAEDPLPVKEYVRKTDPRGYLAPYAHMPQLPPD